MLEGEGLLELDGRREQVSAGQAWLIPAGVEHRITCISARPLVILCACAPPYTHEDTELTEPVAV